MTEDRISTVDQLYLPQKIHWFTYLYYLFAISLVFAGWRTNLEDYINAESGLGYALGITGGTMILLVLLYPLRKRARWMHSIGRVPNWFRIHMIMGTIAPILILYHCGFKLGATNSNITLVSMFLVVLSGFVGRYIYGKIHFGLYGEQVTLRRLQRDSVVTLHELDPALVANQELKRQLEKFTDSTLRSSSTVVHEFCSLLPLSFRLWTLYFRLFFQLKKAYEQIAIRERWSPPLTKMRLKASRRHLLAHLLCLRKIAGFRFFERLFGLWHSVHIPFLFILIGTALYHVYAVHKY